MSNIAGIFGDTFEALKDAVGGTAITTGNNTGSAPSSSDTTPPKTTTTI